MSNRVRDAVVVGSGPNGLAAAIRLAQAGLPVTVYEGSTLIGGGLRSREFTAPGVIHDECASILPLGIGSPYLQTLPLDQFGLEYLHPPTALAHPLDNAPAATLARSLEATVEDLGRDGPAYRRLMKPLVDNWDDIAREILGPPVHLPRHPVDLTRFGLRAVWPAAWLARAAFREDRARALVAGNAAHAVLPVGKPLTASIALVLVALAHTAGWPVARGGSQALADAMAGYLRALGGAVVTGERIDSLARFGPGTLVLLDTPPREAVRLAGDRFPRGFRNALLRYRHGPGVFKLDYLLDGPIPWRDEACTLAGTVHLGGTLAEMERSERMVARGRHPKRPFVLMAQPTVADPSRAPAGQHVAWAYIHVPRASTVDMTGPIEAQIERFAPGFRTKIIQRRAWGPADLERMNPNLIGGDIAGGAMSGTQFLLRPTLRPNPYATPDPLVYICSSSTPPGGGVHGMSGFYAAESALHRHRL